ncbi:MAG TPA: Crp/Fnr family transcriptional regulator [Pseudonocardiaceae bacterium]|nr:Crp/Fnr family transcriptional regulator [Pseudonocardiaceae bacterium]
MGDTPKYGRALHCLRAVGSTRPFRRGEKLMQFGEPSDEVLLIELGLVKVILPDISGGVLISGMYGPGELVGELGVMYQRTRSATIMGHADGAACHIWGETFLDLVQRNQDVDRFVNATVVSRLDNADRARLELGFQTVPTRVATQLLAYGKISGERTSEGLLLRGLSQDDLAGAVGAARRTVELAVGTLRSLGLLVSRGRSAYLLPDPDRLEDQVEQWRRRSSRPENP